MRSAGSLSTLVSTLVASLWLGVSCSESSPASTRAERAPSAPPRAGVLPEPPTIVLITLDTVRREHMGCYGYFRETTPHIDAFARESLVFERALASMASTLPSHLTMLTGLYPHQHGMGSNMRGASIPFKSGLGRLSAAEVLGRKGYRTAAFVSARPLAPSTGIDAGFETFSCHESSLRAGTRNEEVLAWLDEQAGKPGPFFLWVHYFDPHEPNDPLPPYDTLFATDPEQEEWIRSRRLDYRRLSEKLQTSGNVQRNFIPIAGAAAKKKPGKGGHVETDAEVTPAAIADLMNRYDGELRYTDDRIGELLEALRRHHRYDDSILVLAGDHGQSLGENGWFGHGTVTDVNTFVPFVIRLPGGMVAPGRISALVSLADLMPTVLARFELPGSELLREQFEGEDVLTGHFLRDSALTTRSSDIRVENDPGQQYALLAGPWKFIYRPEGAEELYDLTAGGEFEDVLAREPAVGARLRARVEELLARHPARLEEAGPVDESLLRSLEELGYGGEHDADGE